MSEVDDRIVSMKFDNETFERKLSDTIKSLDMLRKSLDFANSTRGINDLSTAAKTFDMSPMGSAVEGISGKFLAMSTIAITAIAQITSRAITAGADIAKAFTLDPILDGFREYETNIGSIQTILANTDSKGTTLDQVNAALDKLNTYSDQTIYNFSEMARNIGTFTAAGVDLDTSVNSIKGIANLAAISGSNSQQAATAMYQLSQAIAAGKVTLMDWNSVVNAGMGGEVFQRALFETGKSMGTIANVPMGQTFEEWTDAGNTFRGSLQEGWLTSEVLTNTLQGFTGDLNEAQLVTLGYTQEQAQEFLRLGALGKAAATEVKTFSQLMGTVKESVGSGWSTSFRTVIGDFNEAKTLFTGINTAIGGMISRSADARNQLLNEWKFMGGRNILIEGLVNGFKALFNVLGPIKDAFRNIFPPMTSERLLGLTQGFANFTEKLRDITERYAPTIGNIFRGIFGAIEIGIEIVKNVARVFGELFSTIVGFSGGHVLDFFTDISRFLMVLNDDLVGGGGIRAFFDNIVDAIHDPIGALRDLKDAVLDFFGAAPLGDALSNSVGRLGDRFNGLRTIVGRVSDVWSGLADRFSGIIDVLERVWDYIRDWFSHLGGRIADAMQPGDFDAAVDVVNVGLLGGIALMLRRFLNGGISLDFGEGLVSKITEAFDGLTGTLQAMQANLRASALLRIAAAVGVLTAAIVVLSTIDSAALTRALTAIAVGFGQLVAVMITLDRMNLGTGAARLATLSVGLGLVAAAAVILSVAIKNLSELGWMELARGLAGVAGGLAALTASTQLIASDTAGMVRAGIAMGAMAVAMVILAEAVKSFSDMSWGEMAQGLIGVGAGLLSVTVAMNAMPTSGMVANGVGLILVAGALRLLVEAVEAFADVPWGEMTRGFVGIGVGLGVIAAGMHLMPPGLPITATGLVIVAGALLILAEAVENMGDIPFGEMAKGIGGMAVMLGLLATALILMTGTAAGAGALIVAAGAMFILAEVLEKIGDMSLTDILKGLLGMGAVLLVLGAGALVLGPLAPALMQVALAMALVGGAFALFGVGAMFVAKAFETMARSGRAGASAIVDALEILIGSIPMLVGALGRAIIDFANEMLEAAPLIIRNVRILLSEILTTVIELVPQIAEALGTIISEFLTLVREKFPEIVTTGYEMLIAFLQGTRDHISEIISVGTEMIQKLVDSLIQNMPMLVSSAVTLLQGFLGGIAERAGDIITAGVNLLTSFLQGIADNVAKIVESVTLVITTYLNAVAASLPQILTAGLSILVELLKGIGDNLVLVVHTVGDVITEFITAVGNEAERIVTAGLGALVDLLDGISDNLNLVTEAVFGLITEFVTSVGANASRLVTAGADALIEFLQGIGRNLNRVVKTGVDVVISFIEGLADNTLRLATAAADVLIDFLNGLAAAIRQKSGELRAAGRNIAGAIIEGLTGGLSARAGEVTGVIGGIVRGTIGSATSLLGINSPSKVFIGIGESITEGFILGIGNGDGVAKSASTLAGKAVTSFGDVINKLPYLLPHLDDLEPVIRPVIDMTEVMNATEEIYDILNRAVLSPTVSTNQAEFISGMSTNPNAKSFDDDIAPTAPTEVKFEQNIYSPTPLTPNDIYRGTKSQFALAKEELSI